MGAVGVQMYTNIFFKGNSIRYVACILGINTSSWIQNNNYYYNATNDTYHYSCIFVIH